MLTSQAGLARWGSWALVTWLILLGGCAAAPRADEPNPLARMRADRLLRSGKFDAAIARYQDCLRQPADDAREQAILHHRLSQAYWGRQGRIGDQQATADSRTSDRAAAIRSAQIALELLESVPKATRHTLLGKVGRTLGVYLREEGKPAQARALYTKLLESESDSTQERAQTLFELARTYFTRRQSREDQAGEVDRTAEDLMLARRHLDEALQIARQVDDGDPLLLVGINHLLGLILMEQLQFAPAVERFTEAEHLCGTHELVGPHAEVLQSLTLALTEAGRYAEASDRCRQLEQLPDASVEPRTMTALGVVYLKLGRPRDALTKFDLARTLCQQDESCRAARSFLAELACNTASAAQEMGAYDEAEQALRKARGEMGDDVDPRTRAVVEANLARIYLTLERLDAAQIQLEAVKAALVRLRGPRHPDALMVELDLASLARARGHLFEARKRYEEAIRALIGSLGRDHQIVASARLELAALYLDQGLCSQALQQAQQAQQVLESLLGTEHPRAVIAFLKRTLIAVDCGPKADPDSPDGSQLNEAGRRFKRLQDALGGDNVEVLRAMVYFADVTAKTPTAVATALERYRAAEKGFLDLYGNGAKSVAALRLKQARLLQRMDRHDEAVQTCDRALRLMDRSLQQHPIRAELLAALGDSLAATGKEERASKLWRDAIRILMMTYGSDHPRVRKFKEERLPSHNRERQEAAP